MEMVQFKEIDNGAGTVQRNSQTMELVQSTEIGRKWSWYSPKK